MKLRWHIPSTPPSGHVTPVDVRIYRNDTHRYPLCISHAVKRRRGGATVEHVGNAWDGARCADCEPHQLELNLTEVTK